jgi:hypothetical protein
MNLTAFVSFKFCGLQRAVFAGAFIVEEVEVEYGSVSQMMRFYLLDCCDGMIWTLLLLN